MLKSVKNNRIVQNIFAINLHCKKFAYICIQQKRNKMKKGTKVKNQYNETLTVLEVIDNTTVRVYEDINNLYHITKLFII